VVSEKALAAKAADVLAAAVRGVGAMEVEVMVAEKEVQEASAARQRLA
jgi:hypothetical protein